MKLEVVTTSSLRLPAIYATEVRNVESSRNYLISEAPCNKLNPTPDADTGRNYLISEAPCNCITLRHKLMP